VNVAAGKVTNQPVAEALGLACHRLDDALPLQPA
jgi:hypothetical protein